MTLQVAATQLSVGAQGDDVGRLQDVLGALGRDIPADEAANRVLGPGTTAIIKALQTELNLPVTGVVDAKTVTALNERLAAAARAARVVRGTVRNLDGSTVGKLTVRVYLRAPTGEQTVGEVAVGGDGVYDISYNLPASITRADLRVEVRNAAGPVETTPPGSSLLPGATGLEVVDFVVGAAAAPPSAEFERVLADVTPFLGPRAIAGLQEDSGNHEVAALAVQTGRPVGQIAALVMAHRLAAESTTPAPVFYAWLREGLPADLKAIHAAHPDVLRAALTAAVQKGTVRIGDSDVTRVLAGLTPTADPRLGTMFGALLKPAETDRFVQLTTNAEDPTAFWKAVAADGVFAARADKLKLAVQVANLVGDNEPVIAAVLARPDVKQAADLARLSKDQWTSLAQTNASGAGGRVPSVSTDGKTGNLADEILARVEAAFPTQVFAARLGESPVGLFLAGQPTYDLRTTYPASFFAQNPGAANLLKPQERQQLEQFQRVYRLTGNADETIALVANGIRSAQQIARMSQTEFAAAHSGVLSADRANVVYSRALGVAAIAVALYGENAPALNRTGLQALPRLDTARQATVAAEAHIPDWHTLFDTPDSCACDDCASAHGAAAYFVDALQFLGERGARDTLFGRRADLGHIELSCENTNTPLPVVDLVNEILEDIVAPPAPAPFTAFTLAPALETDLAQPLASDALRAAFTPPLQVGARVEVLEPGTRWRAWDQPFAYGIVKAGATLTVETRSRQTTGSPAERRATPQYVNSAAYDQLSRSVYPWLLPFDLPREEAGVFLGQRGLSRRDLIEALQPVPVPFDSSAPTVVLLAAEGLGLSDVERRIIVGEATTPPHAPVDYWGSAQVADLATVRKLCDRANLQYVELDALLSTRFVNPGTAAAIVADATAPDSCDTTTLQIQGISADLLDRLHRFVRLWRAVGWEIWELDRAVCGLSTDPNAPSLTNELLVRLDHLRIARSRLRLSVLQALALWRPIDTSEPRSLYRSLFYNPAVFKPQDDVFRLRPDGQELIQTDKLLVDHAAALQAALRLSSAGFAALAAATDGKLNLANLSLLYRHAIMAQGLHLSVQDLLTAIDLTGIDPFQVNHTEETLHLVDAVAGIRASGFDIAHLDYILRQRFSPAATFVPSDASMVQPLARIRDDLSKLDPSNPADLLALQKTAVTDRISAAIGLSADVAQALLRRVLHSGETAMQRFIELGSVAGDLTRANAAPQFETLEKLLKIANVMSVLRLPSSQFEWLFRENAWLAAAPDPQPGALAFDSWSSLVELPQLRQDAALEDGAVEALLGALTAIATAADAPARATAKAALAAVTATWLGWSHDDVQTLIGKLDDPADQGELGVRMPTDYGVRLLVRLRRVLSIASSLGVSAARAAEWTGVSVSADMAKAIRDAAKSKFDDDAWNGIAVPLQDTLRDAQRAALVGYLVARPSLWNTPQPATADDLYQHVLIDVQMSACQLTSRIKQAIGSVQLFAQRCLMGLEAQVQANDSNWAHWNEWMQNFRVWEANRMIWLYPENWIEPELRDDKTPFFRELESELQQSDLDSAAAELAVMHYLEKLDDVARLEVAGTFQDDDATVHVFGRTQHTPRLYYYRRRDAATLSWTPWEKVELDIESDQLIPVVWNRKLMLIWPLFTEKQDQTAVKMPPAGESLDSGTKHWEIRLAWSELQSGRWTGKRMSDPVRFEALVGQADILFGTRIPEPMFTTGMGGGIAMRPVTSDPPPVPPLKQPPAQPPAVASGGTGASGPTSVVGADRMTFKAIVTPDTLTVRGLLRLDYQNESTGVNAGVAFPFGEFRFSGCRKIVTTAPPSEMLGADFVLAPNSTKFDAMWFDQTGSGLTMLDGTFVVPHRNFPTISAITVNEWGPLPLDPSRTVAERIDIPVLDTPTSPFRLLAPHQDPQFLCDRPCFFMDTNRSFVITSTGHSGFVTRPAGWVLGDVRALGMPTRAPSPDDTPQTPINPPPTDFTVLVPAAGGRRVAQRVASVDVNPTSSIQKTVSAFWSDRAYTFRNFYHPYACEFINRLDRDGIDAVLALDTQKLACDHSFDAYSPTFRVTTDHPIDEVDFRYGTAFDIYNWELFFHVPLLIATRLSANQRFDEAQRWFHYIFDPTGSADGVGAQRYWRTKPFNARLSPSYEQESVEAIEKLAVTGAPADLSAAIAIWRSNAFDPYAVARLRTTAFQKTVVMKYIDNLIAWGDQLFRGDTIETINEATLLYVLAGEILGRRPEVISRKQRPVPQTFNTLGPLGPLSNALDQLELLISDPGPVDSGNPGDVTDPPKTLYFCVQENAKLVGYWSTVADRLFKIRHCMNIEGQVRQLPLFEPPIDPALLVRARAAGLSLGEVLADHTVVLPAYRFGVILQKAEAMTGEVRALGSALLAALEKQDAEALAVLRSSLELQLLQAMRDVRSQQVDDASRTIEGLQEAQNSAQARKDYYASREFTNALEKSALALTAVSLANLHAKSDDENIAMAVSFIPDVKVGAATSVGETFGGSQLSAAEEAAGRMAQTFSEIASATAGVVNTMASYQRRTEEWSHQAALATIDLKQIDRQLAGAAIRLAIAEQELANHDLQIGNARATDDFLHGKYTNTELYQYMSGQLSGVYFQSYQLAYDLAKKAEQCFRFELGLQDSNYIQFGYWDSLRKGLLSGEKLQYDLHRLDAAYIDKNTRPYELTKSVSLLLLDPLALVKLREIGRCFITLPEEIFDLDYPGHYFRTIKSVSITLPCVVGPYATVSCTLRLVKNAIRVTTAPGDDGYRHNVDGNGVPTDDARFVENVIPRRSIAASHGQNDSGMFELNFRDERYLPFEGAGVVSKWSLELFNDNAADFGAPLRQFDYSTIADAILHVKYTAKEDSGAFKDGAIAYLREYLAGATPTPSVLGLDLRRDFATQWSRFLFPVTPANGNVFELELSPRLFPIRDGGKRLAIETVYLLARCAKPQNYGAVITPPAPAAMLTMTLAVDATSGLHAAQLDVGAAGLEVPPTEPAPVWRIKVTPPVGDTLTADPGTGEAELRDLFLVVGYKWAQ